MVFDVVIAGVRAKIGSWLLYCSLLCLPASPTQTVVQAI